MQRPSKANQCHEMMDREGDMRSCTRMRRSVRLVPDSDGLLGEEFLALIPDAVIVVDESGTVVQANPYAADLFEVAPNELIGTSVDSLVPSEMRERLRDHRLAFHDDRIHRPMNAGFELWAQRRSGVRFPVEISLCPLRVGRRSLVIAAIRDVSERHEAMRALRASEDRFRRLFEDAPIGVALVKLPGGTLVELNERFALLAERPEADLLGAPLGALVHPHDVERVVATLDDLRAGAMGAARFECRFVTDSDEERWVRVAASALTPGKEEPVQLIVQVEDISAERAAEERLEHLALHDDLTGLPNRSLALDRIEQALASGDRSGGRVGVAFFDLDHFKVVNDSLGHGAGDELLRQVAGRLANAVRPGDTVARFGGDEFLVCLPGLGPDQCTAERQAMWAVERIRAVLDGPYRVDGEVANVASSWGLALSNGSAHAADTIVRDADAAMYRAKHLARGSISVFDAALRAQAVARLSLETRLRRAVSDEQLRLEYQPIFELATGNVVGAEALLRWEEPAGTLHLPAELIEVAEETGLLIPIGEWELRQVCRDLSQLEQRYGPLLKDVAVNVSVRQLQRSDFAGQLATTCEDAGVDPSRLVVEITEQQALSFVDSVIKQLHELHDLGVTLSLDDFGTGYGSLAYLRRLPIGAVKIDRSFVQGLLSSAEDLAIAKAVIGLADALHLTTVAEGVESAQQAAAVTGLGARLAQGFFFGRPQAL